MDISLFLLGPFLARLGHDRVVALTSRKARALLAYLATEGGRPHYREALSGLLWPDYPDRAARNSLRQVVHNLRRAIGDDVAPTPLLLVSRDTIRVNPDARLFLDVAVLERATAIGPQRPSGGTPPTDCEALRSAVMLYRGPFLEGLSVDDCPAFEEWLLLRREQLDRQMLLALRALATYYEGRSAYDEALLFARRAIELEPWQEEVHRQAMRILALAGRRGEAIAQYRRCRDLVVSDLGVEPGPETMALYERIRDGTLVGGSPPPPLQAHRAEGLLLDPIAAEDRAPSLVVAREGELAALGGFLSQVLAGEGRVVLVTGEAGSGKTTLVEAFARQAMAARSDLLIAIGRCSAQLGAGDAYEPFREVLQMLAGDTDEALNPRHARGLQAALSLTLETLVQQGPDLARLLARDASLLSRARACMPSGAAWLSRLEAHMARLEDASAPGLGQTALCEHVARALRAIARRLPLLVILEDLQWADAASLDMLFHLGRHLQRSRILVVGSLRLNGGDPRADALRQPLAAIVDEFRRQWGDIVVDLTQAEGRAFVEAYLDSQPNRLDAQFREILAEHTGGNPLFTVELVRAMQERGHLLRDRQGRWVEGPGLNWGQLPSRVEAAISQRIRQLSDAERDLLEAASVEGDEFHAEVLAHVRGGSTASVIARLSGPLSRQAHLVAPGSLVTVGGRRLARYRFRHGLFQHFLYGQLDATARARLHGAVGAALEETYGAQSSRFAGQLAQHFEAAGQADKAARYLLEAGRGAARVGAHGQAVAGYERALALLADLPDASERTELEFALQMELDMSLLFTSGWGSPERIHASGRAYELGQRMGWSNPSMLRALRGRADLLAARGAYEEAVRVARELLAAGERAEAPLYVASAHATLAICATMRGDYSQAWEHAAQALDLALNPPHALTADEMRTLRPHADLAAIAVLIVRGYLDKARRQMERITSEEDWITPEVTCFVHSTVALFYAACHDDRRAQQQAAKGLALKGNLELPEVQARSEAVLGWAEVRAGQLRQGMKRLTAALTVQPRQGTLTLRFVQLVLLVEAYLAAGDTRAAQNIVEAAMAQVEDSGAHNHDAQLWRLRGDVLLHGVSAPGDDVVREAEACFQRALEIARQQGALLYELRAATSLARLWARGGKKSEAREALAGVYATFTEGWDSPDLVEAAELLSTLV